MDAMEKVIEELLLNHASDIIEAHIDNGVVYITTRDDADFAFPVELHGITVVARPQS